MPRGASLALLLAIFAVAAMALGCARSGESVQEIRTWTLHVSGADGSRDRAVALPAHLDAMLPRASGQYALRTRVTIDPDLRGRDLVLALPSLPAMATLRANGVEAVALDPPTHDEYRSRGPHAWRIDRTLTHADAIDLELDVAHTWPMSGWIESVPRLSATPGGDAAFRHVSFVLDAGNALALGAMGATGFTYLILFVLAPARRQYGWFAVQAAAAAHYPLFLAGWTQSFGAFDTGLLAVSQTLAALAGLHFTYAAFGLGRPPHWPAIAAACASALGLVMRDRFDQVRVLAPFTCVVCFAIVFLHLARLAQIAQRPSSRATASILALSWVFVLSALTIDGGAFVGLGAYLGGIRIGSWALAFVAMAQAAALSREHIESLRRADSLNGDLAEHVREIETLNDELRRRIGERSREVRASIARSSGDAPWPKPGDEILGRYRVERLVGIGGMGRVYEVTSARDGRKLALKVVGQRATDEALSRFAREAELAALVVHPNVVSVVDFDVADDGLPFLVMELVEGETLERHRGRFGDVPWALGVLAQIAAGLEAIHARAIVHRDLKPANVLVADAASGTHARITDFGISRAAAPHADADPHATPSNDVTLRDVSDPDSETRPTERASPTPLTEAGLILGTPKYMAPELANGAHDATPVADSFAFAVIAFELLTRVYPFDESPVVAAQRGARAFPIAPLCDVVPEAPRAFTELVDAALRCDPPLRPSARAFAHALRKAVPRAA